MEYESNVETTVSSITSHRELIDARQSGYREEAQNILERTLVVEQPRKGYTLHNNGLILGTDEKDPDPPLTLGALALHTTRRSRLRSLRKSATANDYYPPSSHSTGSGLAPLLDSSLTSVDITEEPSVLPPEIVKPSSPDRRFKPGGATSYQPLRNRDLLQTDSRWAIQTIRREQVDKRLRNVVIPEEFPPKDRVISIAKKPGEPPLSLPPNKLEPYREALKFGIDSASFGKKTVCIDKWTRQVHKMTMFDAMTPARSYPGGAPPPRISFEQPPEPLYSSFSQDKIFREEALKAHRILAETEKFIIKEPEVDKNASMIQRRGDSSFVGAGRWRKSNATTMKQVAHLTLERNMAMSSMGGRRASPVTPPSPSGKLFGSTGSSFGSIRASLRSSMRRGSTPFRTNFRRRSSIRVSGLGHTPQIDLSAW